jgi:hypothetical protein
MPHPYTNIALPNSMMLVPKVKMMPLEQKQRLLEKCKLIIDVHLVEQAMIELHLERHREAWDIIYPSRTPYTPPEDFIKELNKHKSYITELQYRYTILEMFI